MFSQTRYFKFRRTYQFLITTKSSYYESALNLNLMRTKNDKKNLNLKTSNLMQYNWVRENTLRT